MNEPVICTIIAKNYLSYARCLVDSFLEQHPGGRAFVLLIDDPAGHFDPDQERFTTVRVEDIGIPQFWVMAFRYTVLELSTAVKPFFLEYLFERHGCDKVCYFDPDIYFYEPIDEILDLLDEYGVVLIPHLTGFLDDEHSPNELTILRSGVYNLGFIGLSRHPELERLLHWWQEKLSKYCVVALERGLFVDQRWMDLAPSLFSSVYIHRDPGCDVAYWNLYHREMTYDGKYAVNGAPLKFFHFSGFSPDQTRLISKHQDRYTFQDLPHLRPLFDGYRECLLAHGYETSKNWPYTYNYQNDTGIRIPDVARTLWRELEADDRSWNPFDTSSGDRFVTNLLAWLNEPVGEESPRQPLVTRLALILYKERSDLPRIFPDVLGRDRIEYVRWFVNWGRDQFAIDDFFIQPMEEQLARFMGSRASLAQQGFRAWLYRRVTNWLFRIGIGSRIERVLGAGFVGRMRNFFIRSDKNRPLGSKPLPSLGAFHAEETDLGVNIVGYLCDETGVGESARATLRALRHRGFPVAWTMARSHTARKSDQSVLHLPEGNPYNVNLLYVNADQMNVVYNELGPEFFAGKYNVAYWAWELERFPEQWFDRFQHLDEIWVGSRFVQNTLAQVAPIPIVIMGVGIEGRPDPNVTRGMLGLPEDKFVFLFAFDMLSVIERKNPFGTIKAYRRAFGPGFRDTVLVIKVTNLDQFPQYRDQLERDITSVSGILIDGYMDRPKLDGLFNTCDAYVSLHRSEGFGMTIAEAMYLGKPVIATAYSGNTDFANITNSYPVEFSLVELEQDYAPYGKGSVWADPDLDHAAVQMRRVFKDREGAQRKGMRAAADIRRWYGSEAMAQKMIERLNITSSFGRP
jgi:glycosyltransferase involved in cell wall biosynthesis